MANGTTGSVLIAHSSDAVFRAWGSAWSALLTTIGMTQSADTGQIDWTTVTRAGVNNTAAGYEIWYNNDSMQGTAPVYIKMEYGQGSSSSVPALWLTAGTGSDGSGTITGEFYSRTQYNISTAWTVAQNLYATRGDGYFFIWGGLDVASTTIFIGYERTVNPSTGAATASGGALHALVSPTSAPGIIAHRHQTLYGTTTQVVGGYHPAPGFATGDANTTVGLDVYLFPASIWFPSEGLMYFAGTIGYGVNDFAYNGTWTADTYGGSYTWRAVSGTSRRMYVSTSPSVLGLAVRW